MNQRVKSLVKQDTWEALKEEVLSRIKLVNLAPIDVDKLTKDEVYKEASQRYGRTQILDILDEIQEEALKGEL